MNNAQPKVDFKAKQAEFTAYIRDPVNNPRPADVKKERIDTYRELFFNNVDSFLGSNFPVLKEILTDQQWYELTQDFFSKHPSQSPYFSEIPEEFLEYLQNERNDPNDYPFMMELAHYEWVEMALSISKEHSVPIDDTLIEDLQSQSITVSELAWPLAYHFPVQQISPTFLPENPPEQPTFLVVFRDQHDDVHFLQINAMTFRLLQIVQESEDVKTLDCLESLAAESTHPNPQTLIDGGLQILQDMAGKGIIVHQPD